jgi:hypothetical protein
VPAWKREADSLFVQVSWSLDGLLRWRETVEFDGRVYAGVMVVASASMGRKLASASAELAVPDHVLDLLDRDADAGVGLACDLVEQIAHSGAFDGVHLIPVTRYRDVAARLEQADVPRARRRRRPTMRPWPERQVGDGVRWVASIP